MQRLSKASCFHFILVFILIQNRESEADTVLLYKEENHLGLLEDLTFYRKTSCMNLTRASGKVSSVDNLGACFKLYDQLNCEGNSVLVSSREFAYNNLKKYSNRDLSIGLCETNIDLYAGDNFTGSKESLKLLGTEDCVPVGKRWHSTPIKSIDTNGGCAILHDDPACRGHSLKFNAGPNGAENFKKWDFSHKILSLSSCDNFDNSRSTTDEPISYALYNQYGGALKGTSPKCGCQNLEYKKLATSVATNGHCVRLYSDDGCQGRMIELRPDSLFKSDLGQLNFTKTANSVSSCEESCTNLEVKAVSSPVSGPGPILGEYLFDFEAVVIKLKDVPSSDHFCELTRRCTKNRQFDCEPLLNKTRCYCTRTRKVMCDSVLVDPGSFVEEPWIGFPIVGQYGSDNDSVYLISSSYETPGAPYCDLVKRCTGVKGHRCDHVDGGKEGGRGLQSECQLESRSITAVM